MIGHFPFSEKGCSKPGNGGIHYLGRQRWLARAFQVWR
jgi:hypothetical protein